MITKYRKQPKGKVSLACGRQPPRWPPITLFFVNCIGVQLIYSGVLVSGVQQSGWAICTFTIFFFILVYYRILSIVPCAIQQDLIVSNSMLICFSIRHSVFPSRYALVHSHQQFSRVPIFYTHDNISFHFFSFFKEQSF